MCVLHKVSYTCRCPDKLVDREKCPAFIQAQPKHYDDAKEIKEYNLAAREGRHREMECEHETDHAIKYHEFCRQQLNEAQQNDREKKLQMGDIKARKAARREKSRSKSGNGEESDGSDKTIKPTSSSHAGSSTDSHIYPPEIEQTVHRQAQEAREKNPRNQRPPPPLSERSIHPGIQGHLQQQPSSPPSRHAASSSKDGPEWI